MSNSKKPNVSANNKTTTTQVAEQTPAQEAIQETAQVSNVQTFKRHIISVTQGETPNRYYFEVDGEPFRGLNRNQEEKLDNSFSKNLITIMRQVGIKTGYLHIAYTMSKAIKNSILDPSFIALCLSGAEITFEREFKEASEDADPNNIDDINGNDRYITTFKDIKLNISDFVSKLLESRIANPYDEKNPLIIIEKKELAKAFSGLFD